MKDLVTSLQVAKYFDKRHDNVLRDIHRIFDRAEEDLPTIEQMFFESSYGDPSGRRYPFYYMTYDGLALLIMGYTGEKAFRFKMDYIQSFNALEHKLFETLLGREGAAVQRMRNTFAAIACS